MDGSDGGSRKMETVGTDDTRKQDQQRPVQGGIRNLIWGILSLPCAVIFALFKAVFLRGLKNPGGGDEPENSGESQNDGEPGNGETPQKDEEL